jgi:hypothetical protein
MKRKTGFFIYMTLFTTLSFSVPVAFAAVYKWVDENGQTTYSQNPPPGNVEYEEIGTPGKVDSARALKKLRDDKIKADKLRRQRLEKQADLKKSREEVSVQKENCDMARGKLASLQRPRAKILQPDGSRIRLNEEERQRQIKEAEDKLHEWCDD